jgi:membrane-bound lytic murein transglycosylase D
LFESGGLPTALSLKGARGVWQFMPDTARRYGLVVDGARDDRIDVVRSTHAAARYLRGLRARFGDWSLALAAYNAGEAAVRDAISDGASLAFGSIRDHGRLPIETLRYVPAIKAAMGRLQYGTSWLDGREPTNKRIVYASSVPGE